MNNIYKNFSLPKQSFVVSSLSYSSGTLCKKVQSFPLLQQP